MNIIILAALALAQPPAKETPTPSQEPFIANLVKPEQLSKADFDRAKDLVLKLPEIQKQIEQYGKNYRGEAGLLEPKKDDPNKYIHFWFRDGNEYLAQMVYVNLTEWKAVYKLHTDVEDKKMLELDKLKQQKLKEKEKEKEKEKGKEK